MGARERKPLPFGMGLDRASGTMVVDPTVFNDIRNVHLNHGRTEIRKGLLRSLILPAPWTDLLGVYLIRAQGLAAAIAWDSVAKKVGVFAVDASGVNFVFVDYLWTIATATQPPRISATDQYDQLVIAHDEPVYPQRQVTMVYNAVEATIGPLTLDLGRTGSPEGVKFRGVTKHLAYVVGWGYGTNQPDQGDRGEVLRISKPGEPTTFEPEHYFLVGTQGDPIIGAGAVGGRLAVQKVASSFVLNGADRLSFGIERLDPKYGLASGRLGVPVNEEWFFWSLSGPRSTVGGASSDLGLPLEVAGVVPDALASATAQENGFAFYNETEREVVFVFGQWAYVLHLKDGDRRWSYRQYAIPLVNAGSLYVGGTLSTSSIASFPQVNFGFYIEPSYAPGDGDPKITVGWANVGPALTGVEMAEVWVQPQVVGGIWRRKAYVNAGALTATFKLDGFWTEYRIAVRYTAGGFAGPGYASADPWTWPGLSRDTRVAAGQISAWTVGKWKRYSSISQGYDALTFVGPGINASGTTVQPLTYEVQVQYNGGGYVAFASGVALADVPAVLRFLNSDSLKVIDVRMRPVGPWGPGIFFNLPGPHTIGPEAPSSATCGPYFIRTPNNNDDQHNTNTWTAPNTIGPDTPADGPYEFKMRHTSNPSPPGAFGTLSSVGAGVHTFSGYIVPLVDPSTGGVRVAEFYVRVNVGSGDVSPFILATLFEP